jgi:hypothetical protein
MSQGYAEFYRRSIEDRDAFWTEQAELVDWHKPFDRVCNHDHPPFAHWFEGGLTNLCHNAVDRHLQDRADQNALIYVSTETDTERTYSFPRIACRGAAHGSGAAGAGREEGRSGVDLHAHDSRSHLRHAGLRAHRRHSLGGVRRFRKPFAGQPH